MSPSSLKVGSSVALKKVVTGLTLKNRVLKKTASGAGEDDA